MNRVSSIFSQLLQLFPRLEFEALVQELRAERHARGFTGWGQWVAMLLCQLARAHSLREIGGGLASCEGKLRHLGLSDCPRRSTLAYANQHRPGQLYQAVFYKLLARCRAALPGAGHFFRFKNKLLSRDASLVALCLSLYDWALFQRAKGAVKLHRLLDQDGYLPACAVITTGRRQELTVARWLHFQPGTILVFDKAYADYRCWKQLTQQGVYWVTRWRDDALYALLAERPVPPTHSHILRDQDIRLPGYGQLDPDGLRLRRMEVGDPDTQPTLVFGTNHLRLAASTMAALYRQRWQIETFFKSLKQWLKLKTFVGTSPNAVLIRIGTAWIVMLILRWLKLQARFSWSLSNLVALLRQQLFVYRDLWRWLDYPFAAPPAALLLANQLLWEFNPQV